LRIESKIPVRFHQKFFKGILEESPFCDDELTAEYFGGVLASSRTENGRDDRGASFLSLIGRLSSYQIRSHFFFYRIIRELYDGMGANLASPDGRRKLRTFVPLESYLLAMEFNDKENINVITPHVMFGLWREMLIESEFGWGPDVKASYPGATDAPGLFFSPSALGAGLFLWAHGRGDLSIVEITSEAAQLSSTVSIKTGPGIHSTHFPERTYPEDKAGTDGG
jgi:hypothetical protein